MLSRLTGLLMAVGDTWTAAPGPGEGTATAAAIAACQAPTGAESAMESHDNCLKVVIEGDPRGWHYRTVRWYVSEVGLIKQTAQSDSIKTEMVLTKYRRTAGAKKRKEKKPRITESSQQMIVRRAKPTEARRRDLAALSFPGVEGGIVSESWSLDVSSGCRPRE